MTGVQTCALPISTNGYLRFNTMPALGDITTAPTARMVIGPTGNVGIGVVTPNSLTHIEGSTAGDGGTTDGSNSILYVKQNTVWSANQPWALYVTGYTYLNGFRINAGDGIRALYKTAAGGQLGFAVTGDDPITFTQSTSIERVRINSGGNVGIGTTSPGSLLDIRSSTDRKSTRLNSSHIPLSRMPSSA